jgi:hypothetical protein
MEALTRIIVFVAMVILTIVSMWTTYVSLHDSILPEPEILLRLGGFEWECSIFALLLSVALGLMLFALKLAIIDGHKRLNIVGIIGMAVVAFISITFNLDVLYRTADRDFFLRYSSSKMRGVYDEHLAEVQSRLVEKKEAVQKQVARQEGELESEIRGFRQAPSGYGPIAKEEAHQLTILQKTAAVDLDTVTLALATIGEANQLLRTSYPTTLDEIERLQNQLRVLVRDVTAMAALPMPSPVQLENPLFAVIGNLFDYRTAGLKEFFFLAIAIFLDLGDIVGYTLVPNKAKDRKRRAWIPRRHTEVAPAFEVTSLPTRKDAVPDELPFEEPKFPAAGSGGKWV